MTIFNSICLVVGCAVLAYAVKPPPYEQNAKPNTYLLNNRDLLLSWTVDWANEEVTFNVDNPFKSDRRFFMFGFSYWENVNRLDYVLFDRDRPVNITDGSLGKLGDMRTDRQQDWHLLSHNFTAIRFKRKFDTCDPFDIVINEQTMHIVWVRSNWRLVKMSPNKSKKQVEPEVNPGMGTMTMVEVREHDGITPMQLLSISTKVPESNFTDIPFLTDHHKVGPGNFYLCKMFKVDQLLTKHHLVEWYPILNYPHLHHHIALFHCDVDPSMKFELYNEDCMARPAYFKQCQRSLVVRGIGVNGFSYPPEVGLPIGGPGVNPYYRLEVHYVNMDNVTGMIDKSGVMLRVLDKPRKYDAGVLELGLTFDDTFAIPPGQIAFPLGSRCDTGCTSATVPKEGIRIFGGGFHAHSHGRRMTLHHIRKSQILGLIFQEEYYSERAQHYFLMREPVTVLPGDELLTQCVYDTLSTNKTVTTGLGSNTEMCLQYILYYPAINMVRCKTLINQKWISKFFGKLQNKFPGIHLNDTNAHNYNRIDWTPKRIDELHNFYTNTTLDAQCAMTNDKQLPGNWTDLDPQWIWPIANLTRWVNDGECPNPKRVSG